MWNQRPLSANPASVAIQNLRDRLTLRHASNAAPLSAKHERLDMTNPVTVMKGLTKAQRRIVCELPTDGSFADAYEYCRQRKTRMALNNAGITEPGSMGPITTYWTIRLTPLGLAVRNLWEKEQ